MTDRKPGSILEVTNETGKPIEVSVEVNPDRYILRPGDRMFIHAELAGAPFTVSLCGDGRDSSLQIYPGNDSGCPVTINGVPVEPDFETSLDEAMQPRRSTRSPSGPAAAPAPVRWWQRWRAKR